MYDFLVETLYALYRNGFSVTAIGAVAYVLLRQRRVKKRLKKYIPWLFEDESEVKGYIQNQHTIMENQKLIMERMGIECHAPTSVMSNDSTRGHRTSYAFSSVEVSAAQDAASRARWSYTKSNTRRVKKMKSYLKKLGRTKFQALLASLIVNGISAYLFLSGTLDIDGVLNTWMPIVNLSVGTVSTWVYIIVEGGIDKANVSNGNVITGDTGPAE